MDRAARFPPVVTIEDNAPSGGFGDAFARTLRSRTVARALPDLITLALPDRAFLPAGDRADLLRSCGLDVAGVVDAVTGVATRTRGADAVYDGRTGDFPCDPQRLAVFGSPRHGGR